MSTKKKILKISTTSKVTGKKNNVVSKTSKITGKKNNVVSKTSKIAGKKINKVVGKTSRITGKKSNVVKKIKKEIRSQKIQSNKNKIINMAVSCENGKDWSFELQQQKIPTLKKSVLIVGLPGIGNVGKVAADFIIDEIKAKPLYNVFSHNLPNSVFVNEDNLVELPEILVYYKKTAKGKPDVLILTGDVQPSEDQSSYTFCQDVLDTAKKFGLDKVITLGGIGLAELPTKPSVYCTGNSKEAIAGFVKGVSVNKDIYGTVGPIIGVSGVMVGLAQRNNIPALCVLSETLGHPAYLGIKGAREIVKVLNKKLGLNIKISHLDKEIEDIEKEILMRTEDLDKIGKKEQKEQETSYIG